MSKKKSLLETFKKEEHPDIHAFNYRREEEEEHSRLIIWREMTKLRSIRDDIEIRLGELGMLHKQYEESVILKGCAIDIPSNNAQAHLEGAIGSINRILKALNKCEVKSK